MRSLETMLEKSARNSFSASEIDQAQRAAQRLLDTARQRGLIDVSYTKVDSPFGKLLIAATTSGLVRLAFPEQEDEQILQDLARRISPRVLEAPTSLDPVRRELDEYFAGTRRAFEVALDWKLIGPFACKVLRLTSAIPYGALSTYGQLASGVGVPRGSRAAGNALGSNPIPIVIPCHRVLRAGGHLGGYAGGLDRKRWLLELEGAIPPAR